MSIPYINNLLLSLPAQGFLWLIFLFIFSFGSVHIFILAKIGAENIHKKEDAPKPKEEETKKEKAPAAEEPIYYIVERKTRRAKPTYGEPKQIRFK